ncbi:MAG TPA: bis(5'-nucleosyl)-tetraphosphatase (symmetrical) YqeK [Thermotogota bacterium]|nr:bis(5'-nucleosyl)-tetraphosphatase (symmetrical) YqeK [Thermotogota bacterium]NLZ13978.1 HD domain-containing protein [Thermotogaceae bacterium]OQC31456.1 MAG: putative nicotinate-nucleotide adenylyltransferase [Thermotogota bacterium ADurb.Bin062]HNR63872.1 bis(5'-nucleosyl)-tetraphosphatase (symmetrical) YqeK [Thermotogota bacterium]HNT95794.1 bis(5'-nucleosyl)-tetraphosphatase (symmetrical) YqeK [Thermotogota bacterium]
MAYATLAKELRRLIRLNLSEKRTAHISASEDYANRLCVKHRLPYEPVMIGVLAHDLFREWPVEYLRRVALRSGIARNPYLEREPILYHGIIAGLFLKRWRGNLGFLSDIVEAVTYHTTGYPFRCYIGKILFLADSLEETRDYPGVKRLRKLAERDYENGFNEVLEHKIGYYVRKKYLLLPETVAAWNSAVTGEVWKV